MTNEEAICDAYLKRVKTRDIQKLYNINPIALYKILKKNNVGLHGNRLSKEKSILICEQYKSGKTMDQIRSNLGVGKSCIAKQLELNGIQTRKIYRKYELNEDVLRIDSHEKAQFLGLIYSDGSLSKFNNNISIRLREDDLEYLEAWKLKLLRTDKPIYFASRRSMISPLSGKEYKTPYRMAILDLASSKIYKDAKSLGLCPNKTKANLGMPKIKKEYIPSFILGLFEGDGCVSASSRTVYFSIACQENMANDIFRFLKQNGIYAHIYKRPQIYNLCVMRKKDIRRVYNLLYKNSTIHLNRKKIKFETIIANFK